MPKHILDMYLAPIIDDESTIRGYEITYAESEAVFRITYTADHWYEVDENGYGHEYCNYDTLEMEILGLSKNTFQFVRVAESLDRYLLPHYKKHFNTALITGSLND